MTPHPDYPEVDSFVDLYWLPVGAGTPRIQQASLRAWEAFEAARARRPRQTLLHAALKLTGADGVQRTLELMPAFIASDAQPLAVGPVGVAAAGRFRLFRYQLLCLEVEALPDEEFAVAAPVRLCEDTATIERVLHLAREVPAHTWGRRVRGTSEMWTSDSVVSWLLCRVGVDATSLIPEGCRAPGWIAGIEAARQAP